MAIGGGAGSISCILFYARQREQGWKHGPVCLIGEETHVPGRRQKLSRLRGASPEFSRYHGSRAALVPEKRVRRSRRGGRAGSGWPVARDAFDGRRSGGAPAGADEPLPPAGHGGDGPLGLFQQIAAGKGRNLTR